MTAGEKQISQHMIVHSLWTINDMSFQAFRNEVAHKFFPNPHISAMAAFNLIFHQSKLDTENGSYSHSLDLQKPVLCFFVIMLQKQNIQCGFLIEILIFKSDKLWGVLSALGLSTL